MFNWMPVSAIIDNKIFCVHGGLSPDMTTYDQILKLSRPTEVPTSGKFKSYEYNNFTKVYFAMYCGLIHQLNVTYGRRMIEESALYFQRK